MGATLPPELWLRVIDCLRKPIVYQVNEKHGGGPLRAAPGSAHSVGPLARPADKDCVALASTCRYLRQLLLDEVAFGELHVCLRDGQLVRHSVSQINPSRLSVTYHDLSTAPFGDRTRRLVLSFFGYEVEAATDAAADAILARVPNLIALEVRVGGAHRDNYSVSEKFARAMATLPSLVDLIFSGSHLPHIHSLQFPNVRRIQTDHVVTSFTPFPNLRELRNDQRQLQEDAYRIPVHVFRKLEVAHYCPPYDGNKPEVTDWFPEDCEALGASVVQDGGQMRLRELVLRHTMHSRCVERIITALASPQLRVFACYDVIHHNEFDKLLALAKHAFPNAAIDFPDTRYL
ncbi:hypothetical protein EXIGLDRAFT_691110 [Exidia glandulosa HHB12029]|uniref:F-box domain-containing protein n=1 Tax=Exidia glandulosa HHB12029 TaxID=1314781 RepID=A0A165IVA2_EXIGL|nr:hypothetical protein EXIGLDRAFT_691110 [Exidia glandulosa HHB12029]